MAAAAIITGLNVAVAVAPVVVDIVKKMISLIETIRKHSNPGPYDDTCLGAVAELKALSSGVASVTGAELPEIPNAVSSSDTPRLCAVIQDHVDAYREWLTQRYVPSAVAVRSALSPTSTQVAKSLDSFAGIDPTNADTTITVSHPAYGALTTLKTETANWVAAFGNDNARSFASIPSHDDLSTGGSNALKRYWVSQMIKNLLSAISTLSLGTAIAPVDGCVTVANPAKWELAVSDMGIIRNPQVFTNTANSSIKLGNAMSEGYDYNIAAGVPYFPVGDAIAMMDSDMAAAAAETWLTTRNANQVRLFYAGAKDRGVDSATFTTTPLPKESLYYWHDRIGLRTILTLGAAATVQDYKIMYVVINYDNAGVPYSVAHKGIIPIGSNVMSYDVAFPVPISSFALGHTRVFLLYLGPGVGTHTVAGTNFTAWLNHTGFYGLPKNQGVSYSDVTYRLDPVGNEISDFRSLEDRNVSMLSLMGKLLVDGEVDDPNYSVQAIFEERHVGQLGPLLGLAIAALKTYSQRVAPGVLDAKYVALGIPSGIAGLAAVSGWMSGSGPFAGKSMIQIQKILNTLISDLFTLGYYVKSTTDGSEIISAISGPLPSSEIF